MSLSWPVGGCEDLEGAYAYLVSQGVSAQPPKTAPYGMRQLFATDPDGYELCFQWPVARNDGPDTSSSERRPISEQEIQAIVDRETAAWDRQDAEALVTLFHPDMVWPWPPDAKSHDPASWVLPQGRYDRERWKAGWQELFRTHELVHNVRKTVRVVLSAEGDGAIAVVDVDTLWRNRADKSLFHWKGRACKGYTRVREDWLLVFHTGLLDYEGQPGR